MNNFALAVTLGFSNKSYENVLKNLLETGNFILFNIVTECNIQILKII